MKNLTKNRFLAALMALVMVISLIPASVFAVETGAVWTKVELADITAEDTIMVTMTNPNGVTYALYTVQSGSKGNDAKVVTVNADGTTISTDNTADYGWTVTPVEGGYTLSVDAGYLYTINNNNGVRIGTTQAVWSIANGFLSASDGSNTRYLGVYDNNNGDYSAVATPNWRAYKNTTGNTKNQTLGFWKLGGAEETPTDPSTPEAEKPVLADGAQVVIYAPGYMKALSATKTGYYNVGVDVALDGEALSGYGETEIWTVIVNEDGTYSFSNGGQNIGLADSNSSMNLGVTHDKWELIDLGNGLYNVKNVGRGNFMEWYEKYSNWSTYNSSYAATDPQFQIAFYVIPTEEEPAGPLSNGSNVVIYAPGYMKALSATKTGYYNVGVDVALDGDTMTGYGETEIWTVIVNEDGTYSFANGGQNIGLADSNSSMNLGVTHDKWELIDLGNGLYNVKNVGRGNFMEWYEKYSNWSTYNSSSAATDPQFQIAFFPVTAGGDNTDPSEPSEPEPEVPAGMTAQLVTDVSELTEGTEIIIVAADSDFAMSTEQKSNNRGQAAITKDGDIVTYGEDTQIITIEAGTVAGTHALFVGEGYLYAASSSKNYLRTEASKSDNSAWTITIDANGIATIKSNGEFTRNWLRYNKTSGLYACYGSGQQDVKIYKLVKAEENPLSEGSKIVIYNPANMMALSTNYTGFYNLGTAVTMENGVLSGYTDADIWTVGVNADGTYTFSTSDGKKLSMGASYSSTPLDDVNTAWEVSEAATADCVYIKNAARGSYLEWYKDKNNWSSYYKINDEALFAQTIYKVPEGGSGTQGGVIAEGDSIVIYNVSAEGVLAMQDDNETSPSVNNAPATVSGGKVTAANGALIFTVQRSGQYYRFYNETFGYLCSNGTGSNAFYQLEANEDADWLLAEYNGGYTMESRTAKYNGMYSQFLEYYAGSYKTYSMYNVTDKDIYTFKFYPCANENVTAGVVNAPSVTFGAMADANVGMDYSFSFTVDAPFGVSELTVAVNGNAVEAVKGADGYSVTVPAEIVKGETLAIVVSGVDAKGVAFESSAAVAINDLPAIEDVTPTAGSQTFDEKKPTISAVIVNGGENPTVTMTVNDALVDAVYENGVISYTPETDMEDGRVTVTVTVTRADGKTATKSWSFTVGKAQFSLYFGQLHSHTTYSDGSGSLESALDYIANLPESANVDFVAFTDHSNYFDKSGAANPEGALYDMSLATAYSQETWKKYKDTIANFNANNGNVIAIGGFEMTWSGGPGHINTFNTPGIVSRNNTVLNNKTSDAGMKAYYALLSRVEGDGSISQFNHPGSTFGTFTDFAYWDAVLDNRIHLVEVGNGEGQIGQGGYYPSYEYYTMALDKGWHVAPTNNQDNHKGKWGNGNDARDVVITDNFTEEGIYEAIRSYRVYATEDKNLEILYTVNGLMLGSVIEEVPEKLNISVSVSDPDVSDSISKVEVIVNSGKTAYTWSNPAELATGNLTCSLDPTYSYYYIRVTEGDGDLAVTAPVWVGETLKLGISAVECGTSTPVTGEELTITTTLFNSESKAATVKALTYAIKGGEVLGTDTTGYTIPASGTAAVDFKYIPTDARNMTVTVTAVVEVEGEEYTFTMDITLDVQDADALVYIGIDASHYNEYVNGNYKDSMGNFSKLAAQYNVRTVDLKTSEDLIAACQNSKYKALILTAPSRRLPAAQEALLTYSDAELAAIKAFNANGGMVILANWSDHYENYPDVSSVVNMAPEQHMAATQNAVLEALGSSLRMGDDATYDDSYNGGQAYRLYFNSYNFDSFLVEGVEVDENNPHDRLYTEVFSYYGGSTVYTVDGTVPSTVTPVVFGHATTYSVDVDKDGLGGSTVPKYAFAENDNRLLALATEQLPGQGLIVVSGAAFMSNFEVQATIEDSASEKNYSNYKICENLLKAINPVKITPIAEVQAKEGEGYKFTIEGVVTSNASGYDKDTAFFDCIYLQDETAGINAFPVAGNFKIGDKVRITGTTSSYNGERQIAVTSIELISEGHTVEPKEVTATQINDGSVLGSLVTLKGEVESFEYANGLVQTILVRDAEGKQARVFIDGYITTAKDVENLRVGCEITVTGLASYDNSFDGVAPRIRIRNRADVVCGDLVRIDYTELAKVVDEWYSLNPDDYTEESVAVVEEILRWHDEVMQDETHTQEDIDAVTAALRAAIDALEIKTTEPVDKTALEAAIGEAEGLNEADYTEESYAAVEAALAEAEAILADENATQEQVDAAAQALKAAIAALEKAPEETKPTDPEETEPTEPEDTEPTEPEETTKPGTGDNVQTGDDFNPIIWIAIMAIALVGVVVLFILRKKIDK